MAREKVRAKKKERKNIAAGVAHVNSSFNNTKILISDVQGNAIAWSSAGTMGFKGSRKSTPYAAQMAAEDAARKAQEHGMKTAWTDKHPAYDILNGPSGTGIDQLFTPEINLVGEDYTTNPASCMRYDTHHVNAIVNWWVQLNPFDL